MLPVLIAVAIAWALVTLYLAIRFRDVRKFLAGSFFVSSGVQFYFYLVNVPVPLLGTNFVFTPEINGLRTIPHFIFFLLCLYYGYFWRRKEAPSSTEAISK